MIVVTLRSMNTFKRITFGRQIRYKGFNFIMMHLCAIKTSESYQYMFPLATALPLKSDHISLTFCAVPLRSATNLLPNPECPFDRPYIEMLRLTFKAFEDIFYISLLNNILLISPLGT